ncbi:MAG: hypothetical protein ACMG6E_00510 [Candidatus Roizmanbacteria bacterium]
MVLPVIVAVVVIFIIAIILNVIALAILIATGRAQKDPNSNTALVASGTMFGLTVPLIIVCILLAYAFIRRRINFQDARGVKIAFIIVVILIVVLNLIASIIAFVTANSFEEANAPDEARNLRGAAAIGLVALVLFFVGFTIIALYIRSKVPKQVRSLVTADTNVELANRATAVADRNQQFSQYTQQFRQQFRRAPVATTTAAAAT